MRLESITVPPIMENCYIFHNDSDAVVFDPGGSFHAIKKILDDKSLTLSAILLTHGHFDHIGAAAELKKSTFAPIYAHERDLELIKAGREHAALFGADSFEIPSIDNFIKDNEILSFNCAEIKVIHTPGHSEGSVCYYIENQKLLISGDTLFSESVGRTDLPGGDFNTLEKSIKEKIYSLPEDTKVYPGHGFGTTIGHEKKFNPIIQS